MIIKYSIRFIILFALLLVFSATVTASEFRSGETLVIAKGQVVNNDLYLAGSSIIVDGVINGDLTVAGGEVRVNGTVNGSLMAAGGLIIMNGSVTDDIRAAGGTIIIGGNVGDNVLAFGGNVILDKNARVKRDLTLGANMAAINGTVDGNINGGASNMDMSGTAMGNVTVNIGNSLRILPGAKIGGNLEYTAPRPAEISGTVSGKTIYTEAPSRETNFVSSLAAGVAGYLWLLVVGIVSMWFAPELTQRITDKISIRPLWNFLWGLFLLIVTPIIAAILLIILIGIPLGLILLAIYIIAIYISRVFVGLWIGQYIFKKSRKEIGYKILYYAVGLFILFILINLPFIGGFIHFIIIALGLGAIALVEYDSYKKLKEQKSI